MPDTHAGISDTCWQESKCRRSRTPLTVDPRDDRTESADVLLLVATQSPGLHQLMAIFMDQAPASVCTERTIVTWPASSRTFSADALAGVGFPGDCGGYRSKWPANVRRRVRLRVERFRAGLAPRPGTAECSSRVRRAGGRPAPIARSVKLRPTAPAPIAPALRKSRRFRSPPRIWLSLRVSVEHSEVSGEASWRPASYPNRDESRFKPETEQV